MSTKECVYNEVVYQDSYVQLSVKDNTVSVKVRKDEKSIFSHRFVGLGNGGIPSSSMKSLIKAWKSFRLNTEATLYCMAYSADDRQDYRVSVFLKYGFTVEDEYYLISKV